MSTSIHSNTSMSTTSIPSTTWRTPVFEINTTGIDGTVQFYSCYSDPNDYEVVPSIICAILLLVGIVYLTYGYRCFKAVLFLTGFAFGTTVIYMICTTEQLLPQLGNISVSVVAGLLFGLITVLVVYVGLFMLGFHLGLLSTCATLVVVYILSPYIDSIEAPNSLWLVFALFMGSGLVGSFATLYFQRGCTIMGTVLYGSTLILICLDYFIENFKLIHWFGDKLRDGQSYESISLTSTTNLCTISWVVLAIWPINCLIGLFTQCLITSIGINYSNDYNYGIVRSATTSRSSAQTTAIRLKREEQKLEQKQKKYRYLYQVRTAHGDVISQNYIQSLNNKVCPPDSQTDPNSTYNSELSNHLTIIPCESRTTTISVA